MAKKVECANWGEGGTRVSFYCPGCGELHSLPVAKGDAPSGAIWGWNGSEENPTITPSILMRCTYPKTDADKELMKQGKAFETRPVVCHSFVRSGKIEFLSDCTHELKGQTVELPDLTEPIA